MAKKSVKQIERAIETRSKRIDRYNAQVKVLRGEIGALRNDLREAKSAEKSAVKQAQSQRKKNRKGAKRK